MSPWQSEPPRGHTDPDGVGPMHSGEICENCNRGRATAKVRYQGRWMDVCHMCKTKLEAIERDR